LILEFRDKEATGADEPLNCPKREREREREVGKTRASKTFLLYYLVHELQQRDKVLGEVDGYGMDRETERDGDGWVGGERE